MAVLWRSNENAGAPDARFREAGDASPTPTGAAANKNTFFEKHVRICDPLPSEAEMKNIVRKIYDDRHKSPATMVPSVTGPSKKKSEIYGKIKPPANSTYFIGLAGFQETNAWIEKNVTSSGKHIEVPIFGNGTNVTYDPAIPNQYDVINAGKIVVDIAVGGTTDFKVDDKTLTMGSKVVYHYGGAIKGTP